MILTLPLISCIIMILSKFRCIGRRYDFNGFLLHGFTWSSTAVIVLNSYDVDVDLRLIVNYWLRSAANVMVMVMHMD
jgi:hypothetical protein